MTAFAYEEVEIRTDLGVMCYPKDDIGITKWVEQAKTYGEFVRKTIVSKLAAGHTFIDVGAHVGYFTRLASYLVGREGEVHAFEPHPGNFRMLAKNTEGLENVKIYNMAISDALSMITIYHSPMNSGDHRLAPWHDAHGRNTLEFSVQARTLDGFGFENVDLVKIDIQGSDQLAVLGMKGIIEDQHPDIIVEFDPRLILACGGGWDKDKVAELYRSLPGYRLVPIPEACLNHIGGLDNFPNNVNEPASIDLLLEPVRP